MRRRDGAKPESRDRGVWDAPVHPLQRLALSQNQPINLFRFNLTSATPVDFDMHYALEMGVVLSGRMRRHFPSATSEVEAGQVWLCGIWEPHGWEVFECPCEYVVVTMLPDLLYRPGPFGSLDLRLLAAFTARPEERPQVPDSRRQEVLSLARGFPQDETALTRRDLLWTTLLSYELLLLTQSEWTPAAFPSQPVRHRYEAIGRAVTTCVAAGGKVSAQSAAEACAMGTSTFCRAFRSMMGLTYTEFCLRHRLGEVATQLATTQKPIKLLASELGFTDTSHLCRSFRRHYGRSPKTYRRIRRRS